MTKKFFLMCLAIVLALHSAAAAKKSEVPEEDRIKVALEIVDGTRHKDFNTSALLESYLATRLIEKNLVNVVGEDSGGADTQTSGVENLGELLIFDAVELPPPGDAPADFDRQAYENLGAAYVVRCEVLALGLTKVENETIGLVTGVLGGGLSIGGAGNSNRDKVLRRVGAGIGLLGMAGNIDVTKRTALNTVVNMQFIDVASGKVLWQDNFIGQSVKHHSGGKNFDDPWTRALHESVDDSAKTISKRVNKYVDNVIFKGKSDKSFLPKKFSGLPTGKLF